MPLSRRAVLTAALPILGSTSWTTWSSAAAAAVPANVTLDTLPVHGYGDPRAGTVVQEWFSLTCTHCAHFSQAVFPEIKRKLIDTGRIRYVFRDYPLDQVALAAAMAADALPDERYLPFIEALLSSQDRWAFNQDGDPITELGGFAALAGLSPDLFKQTMNNASLRQAIVDEYESGRRQYGVDGTPTFVFGARVQPIVADYDTFVRYLGEAGG